MCKFSELQFFVLRGQAVLLYTKQLGIQFQYNYIYYYKGNRKKY